MDWDLRDQVHRLRLLPAGGGAGGAAAGARPVAGGAGGAAPVAIADGLDQAMVPV